MLRPHSTSPPKRVPAKLPLCIDKKLLAYAAAAAGMSALALVQPSQAEVIFTPAHQTIPISATLSIDLDHDGLADFTLENRYVSAAPRHFLSEDLLIAAGAQPGNEMFVKLGGIPIASALVGNTKISSDATLGSSGIMFECATGFSTFTFGAWNNISRRFLGLRFVINGQDHFGWARLSVSSSNCAIRAILTGYAYETEPNQPIHAGQIREDAGASEARIEAAAPASLGRLAQGAQEIAAPRSGN
jgi:hypothetical protein